MPIAFSEIPGDIKVPLFYAEVQSAQTPFNDSLRMLIVGHKNTSSTATFTEPYILSGDAAARIFGPGSMIDMMYRIARKQSPFIEIWGVAVAEAVAAVKASTTLSISALINSSPQQGSLNLWIAGKYLQVVVLKTDSATTLALRVCNAINARTFLPVTAALDSDPTKIVVTCKWAGNSGNSIRIERNYFGNTAPLTWILTASTYNLVGGTGYANIAGGLGAVSDMEFDVLCCGLTGYQSQLTEMDDFMNSSSGRWSPYRQTYGHAFFAMDASYAALITNGELRNGPHVSLIGEVYSPSPNWEWAAAVSAIATKHLGSPPELSRPLQGIEIIDIVPSRTPSHWFNPEERQALITAGVSTWKVNKAGKVMIDRIVTTYKRNVWEQPDESWRDVETMYQIMFFVRSIKAAITGTYPRSALTDEDTGIPGFTSPGQIKDTIIQDYIRQQALGVVENIAAFSEMLIVERNLLDANRVDIMARPDLVNQLRIVAALVETHLQLDTAA